MTQVQKVSLTVNQDQVIQKLAFKQIILRELKLKAKGTEIEKNLIKAERLIIGKLEEEMKSWEIYQSSKGLIESLIDCFKKRFLLLRVVGAYELDCFQCAFIENCKRKSSEPVYCFEYIDAMKNDDFNGLGHDKKKVAIYEEMIKEMFN